jgi:uncharacterized protein (TIGR02246 family)
MPDPTRVVELVHRLVASWNAGDPPAFGRLFDAEADYVGGDGVWRHGRPAIEALCPASADSPRIVVEDDVAVSTLGAVSWALFRWASLAGDRKGVIGCVMAESEDRLRIMQLQNTDAAPE